MGRLPVRITVFDSLAVDANAFSFYHPNDL